jgi:acetyltransferase-like isoleucine patch superfamily enzyme
LLLRRKAYGYCEYSCAYMESAAGRPGRAMRNLAYSFTWYPLFYRRAEMRFSLARVRMWTILLARLLHIGRGRPALGCASGISMNTAGKVRERKRFVRRALKPIVRTFLSGHVPVISITKPLFAALYRLHAGVREGLIWARRFFWHEPLFRSQCASVGRGFRMEALPYITGRGRIVIGERVRLSGKSGIGFGNRKMGQPEIIIGDDTFIGHDCHFGVGESIRIGKHCLIARGVSVRDMDGHPLDAERRRAGESSPAQGIRPVVIEDDVWIGVGAVILKGVTIGARSIVGTGAVVSKDVPPDSVVAGNPARVVRSLVAEAAISQAEAA